MAEQHTFPQSGDEDDAENFGQLIGQDILSNFVARGFGFNPDYGVPEVTISTGLCFIRVGSATAASTGETRLDVNRAVQLPQETVSLTDSAVNYIYVSPDFTTNDNASFSVYTNQGNAGANELYIGSIDTTNDTVNEMNRDPSGSFEDLDVSGTLDVEDNVSFGFGNNSDFVISYDSNNSLLSIDDVDDDDLLNFYQDGPIELGVVFDTNTNDIVDDTTTIWDSSAGYIPQGRLENDSITVTGGNGMSGGTAALGGSLTVDIVTDAIGTDELDLSIAPTWTGLHTFSSSEGGINVQTGSSTYSDAAISIDGFGAISTSGDELRFYSDTGDGGGNVTFRDIDGVGDVLNLFGSDGEVRVPNGNLTDGSNTIYDASESHVPRERLDDQLLTTSVSSNTTTSNEEIIYVDSSAGSITITLASTDALDGNQITIVDVGGNAEANPITIDTESGETIDGGSSTVIETNYSAFSVASDGTNWFTTGAGTGGGGVILEDNGTAILDPAEAISMGLNLDVVDDGDGTGTVNYRNTRDPRM
jgi:hypothetical protein